ncbi:MAG: VCBS repeat-containing protein, partial [Deltaproteobacteria bacterium]|nr:VCBS repeat-containing protein [Deltaproteobacteria bacterium]
MERRDSDHGLAHRRLVRVGSIITVLLAGPLLAPGCSDDDSEPWSPGTGGSGAGSSSSSGTGGSSSTSSGSGGSTTGGETNPTCDPGTSEGDVQAPEFVRNLSGQTSWFASPVIRDLDGDGNRELIAAYYSVYVFDSAGNLLDEADGGDGRVYAPHVVADIDNDGVVEIVYGNSESVYSYGWINGALVLEPGWPVDTTTAGNSPEVRGMSAADLDGDGQIEIVVSTTQTESSESGGAQIFVYSPDGSLYQPGGISWPAWPRYNNSTGPGGDADVNGYGHHGFGCY